MKMMMILFLIMKDSKFMRGFYELVTFLMEIYLMRDYKRKPLMLGNHFFMGEIW
ncbi:unnamed protein product [Brassica oleracea]